MTKEEFVKKFLRDQYLRGLEKRRKRICSEADIHIINNCNKTRYFKAQRRM